MANKNQIIIIQTLLSKCKLRAQKEAIVSGFSGARTEHVSELKHEEAKGLIEYLRAMANDPKNGNITTEAQKSQKMRRKIISLAHEMNWHLPGGKINMKSVDGWCKKYGYLHKPLDDYTYSELTRLLTQFESGPYKHYISNLK